MLAQRFVTKVKNHTLSLELPEAFHEQRVEVIVLSLEEDRPAMVRRHPHEDIAGKLKIHGDVFSSAGADDWNLPG